VQTAQLQHDQEQEEDDRAAGDEQVLPVLPEAHAASGAKIDLRFAICDLRFECFCNRKSQIANRKWSLGQ
jgi:hypothetical protein